MNRRGAETPREGKITGEIIGAAIEVHRELGLGWLLNLKVPEIKDGLKRLVKNSSSLLRVSAVSFDTGFLMDAIS